MVWPWLANVIHRESFAAADICGADHWCSGRNHCGPRASWARRLRNTSYFDDGMMMIHGSEIPYNPRFSIIQIFPIIIYWESYVHFLREYAASPESCDFPETSISLSVFFCEFPCSPHSCFRRHRDFPRNYQPGCFNPKIPTENPRFETCRLWKFLNRVMMYMYGGAKG
jgi:hypothetical protein